MTSQKNDLLFLGKTEAPWTIKRLHDPLDSRITDFRRQVTLENGAPADYIGQNMDYHHTLKYAQGLPQPYNVEEIWKYGDTKWKETRFLSLECVFYKNQIISLSGCKLYTNNMMRILMHLYTLKDYRRICRSHTYCENGLFQKHLDFAKKQGDIDCLFLTIYPYNKKLKSYVKNLLDRKIGPDLGWKNMKYIQDLKGTGRPVLFHNCRQYLFFYPLKKEFRIPKEVPRPVPYLNG